MVGYEPIRGLNLEDLPFKADEQLGGQSMKLGGVEVPICGGVTAPVMLTGDRGKGQGGRQHPCLHYRPNTNSLLSGKQTVS